MSPRRRHIERSLRQSFIALLIVATAACTRPGIKQGAQAADDLLKLLTPRAREAFRALGPPARSRWIPVAVVGADVRGFTDDFYAGARVEDPHAIIQQLADQGVAIAQQWLATPEDQRVFVAGAGADLSMVSDAATQMAGAGRTMYFYDFCRDVFNALCNSTTVGAFFATARHAFIADTPAASRSRYVQREIEVAQSLRYGAPRVIYVTPAEVLTAGGTGTVTGMYLSHQD